MRVAGAWRCYTSHPTLVALLLFSSSSLYSCHWVWFTLPLPNDYDDDIVTGGTSCLSMTLHGSKARRKEGLREQQRMIVTFVTFLFCEEEEEIHVQYI